MSDFKLAHLSDLHLGYRSSRRTTAQGINIREADGYLAFAQCVKEIIAEECDAAVVCGDVFHSSHPSIRSVVFAQNQFRKLAEAGVKVYILGGNHDISDRAEELSAARVLDDPYRGIYSSAEPYVKHEITPGVHLHLVSHHAYSYQRDTFESIAPVSSEVNIFSTHGSVIDPLLKEKLHTELSPREIVIPEFLLNDKDWSYTLLGHIHERGWTGSRDKKTDTSKTKVYYNGSTVRRGFSDKEVPLGKGWTLWSISPSGVFSPAPKKIAQRAQMDFAPINAEGLSAEEISDMIIENLKASQLNGTEFDSKVAPILRQKLVNISPAQSSSLNYATIEKNSQHALHWIVSKVAKDTDGQEVDVVQAGDISGSGDIVKVFDEWAKKSKTIEDTQKEIRDTVITQSRHFVQLGQEATNESD